MNRTTLSLALAAFLLIGFICWVAAMPKPADAISPESGVLGVQGPTTDSGTQPVAQAASGIGAAPVVNGTSAASSDWLARASTATGISRTALDAYASAAISQQSKTPDCKLGWNTVAAIGAVESENGTLDGATVGTNGEVSPTILGPVLDGKQYAAVKDTDGGKLDHDTKWDRAVGPMQFLPATWTADGIDGDSDGVADPDDINDAAASAAAFLCAAGGDLSTADGWTAAIHAYNPDPTYPQKVLDRANQYAAAVAQ